jgi:hypothetical protein
MVSFACQWALDALLTRNSVFLDTASSHLSASPSNLNVELNGKDSIQNENTYSKRVTDTTSNGPFTWSTAPDGVPTEILAFAHELGSSLTGDDPATSKHFTPIDASLLHDLTKRYPNGTMWTFGEAGLLTPTESPPLAQPSGRRPSVSGTKARRQQRESEAEALRLYFPHTRQLIFAPLFDAALERSTAG